MAARIRSTAPHKVLRSLTKSTAAPPTFVPRCASSSLSRSISRHETFLTNQAKPLALSTFRQPTSIVRYASSKAPGTSQNPQKEDAFAAEKLEANPGLVSTGSSVHPVFSEVGKEEEKDDVDMMAGIRHDLVRDPRTPSPQNLSLGTRDSSQLPTGLG